MRLLPTLLLATFLTAGCGGRSESVVARHDLAAFSIGVEVDGEVQAVSDNLTSRGFLVGTTLTGEGYRAFDAAHPDGRSLVRVITRVGIAVALDVPAEERADPVRLRRALGISDLVVVRTDTAWGRECFALLRPASDGRVPAVPLELAPFGEGACIEEIRDLDGDGRPELLTRLYAAQRLGEAAPMIPGVLVADLEGYRRARSPECDAFWDEERDRRLAERGEAHRALDVPRALRLAVELALVARARGESTARQLTAFDQGMAGLVLSAEEAQVAREARTHIADGWPE